MISLLQCLSSIHFRSVTFFFLFCPFAPEKYIDTLVCGVATNESSPSVLSSEPSRSPDFCTVIQ